MLLRSFRSPLPLLASALVTLAALTSAGDAQALGPIGIEAGLKVGAGTNPDSNGPNPYGFGLGGRAGVQLFNVYLGVSAIHYFGGSMTAPLPQGGPEPPTETGGPIDFSSTLVGAEVGYTITALPIINIRPQLGLGNASFTDSFNAVSESKSKLYLEPGVTVLIPLGLIYIGADGNALIVPSGEPPGGGSSKTLTSFTLHGQFGIRI